MIDNIDNIRKINKIRKCLTSGVNISQFTVENEYFEYVLRNSNVMNWKWIRYDAVIS